ncbi:hypothetical protein HanIR_Chr15g0770881 [Helianthus annuus]|nr:hypothetical protein HanIR_Chr15g0770881 [Helianthus annuus]
MIPEYTLYKHTSSIKKIISNKPKVSSRKVIIFCPFHVFLIFGVFFGVSWFFLSCFPLSSMQFSKQHFSIISHLGTFIFFPQLSKSLFIDS